LITNVAYDALPEEHWRCIRTSNLLEQIMREIRQRTRVFEYLNMRLLSQRNASIG